jgi:hypothetical protein
LSTYQITTNDVVMEGGGRSRAVRAGGGGMRGGVRGVVRVVGIVGGGVFRQRIVVRDLSGVVVGPLVMVHPNDHRIIAKRGGKLCAQL